MLSPPTKHEPEHRRRSLGDPDWKGFAFLPCILRQSPSIWPDHGYAAVASSEHKVKDVDVDVLQNLVSMLVRDRG